MQIVMGAACLVPIIGGLAGVLRGPALLGESATADGDSHFRYLSGLLLGIGLAYASLIPSIERERSAVRLLTGIVVIGGLARLGLMIAEGPPSGRMIAALIMELVVTPSLALWQARVATRAHLTGSVRA